MGASANPADKNPFNKIAGPAGWALGIVTGVVFIGLLYNTATHGHDDSHGGGHGDAHADEHADAKPADAKPAEDAH